MAALGHARGAEPPCHGRIRVEPADFRVDEECAIELTGAGEHLWCRIEKTGLTTHDAVQAISRRAGVHPRHIGFAGLKDRHAVTRQWLSIAWPVHEPLPDLDDVPGVRIESMVRHERKLKRGAHRGNRFVIRVRDLTGDTAALEDDIRRLAAHGVPNYFGAQRFGHGGRNIGLARRLFAGRRLSRNRRGFALSAARSLLFNAVLDARVRDGSWQRLLDGEAVMLDGSHSLFARNETEQGAEALEARLAAFDIHPSGPLPGRPDGDVVSGIAAKLESGVLADYPDLTAGLAEAGLDSGRRALRLPVRELDWHRDGDALTVSFRLPTGAFATSVLREIVNTAEAGAESAVDA